MRHALFNLAKVKLGKTTSKFQMLVPSRLRFVFDHACWKLWTCTSNTIKC